LVYELGAKNRREFDTITQFFNILFQLHLAEHAGANNHGNQCHAIKAKYNEGYNAYKLEAGFNISE